MTDAATLFPKEATPKKSRAPRRNSLERIIQFESRELLDWIEERAKINRRNLSQELNYRLSRSKEGQEKAAAGKPKGE